MYGVDAEVVRNATERFPVNVPKHFDSKYSNLVGNTKKERAQSILPKQYDFSGVETNRMKTRKVASQLFIPGSEKHKLMTTKTFLDRYVFYINKLLNSRADPFIKSRSEAYMKQIDYDKLSKFTNVFDRLSNHAKAKVLGMIEENPLLAGYGVNSTKSITASLGEPTVDPAEARM